MSVVFSGTFSGSFVSTGAAQFINLPSGVDWMWIKNETVSYAGGAGTGAEFYWRRGNAPGRGTIYIKNAISNALAVGQIAANAGFYLSDTTMTAPGPILALTNIDGGTPPTVFTALTTSLNNGDIVRIFDTVGAFQLAGYDFTINNVDPGVSFDLAFMQAIVAAAGPGTFARIPYNPYFYPSYRLITNISQAVNAIVTLSVTNNYTVGQVVRFVIPEVTNVAFGMTQLNGLQGTIVAVGDADADGFTNTITVDIDTTGFNAFAFPLTANGDFTPAQVIPVGENTAAALAANTNILADATVNTGQRGMLLMAGASSPAGVASDVISWVAGKSFNQ